MQAERKINFLIFPIFLVIGIGLLAWISTRQFSVYDLTTNHRNSLTEPSVSLLKKMEGSVTIDVFVNRSDQMGQRVEKLLSRYQRVKPDISVNYISPEENPEKVREYNIRFPAEMLIHFRKQTEQLERPSEEALTNALSRLMREGDRWLVFLSGHGERDPAGEANFDLGNFSSQLKKKGLKPQAINLSETSTLPDNTALLVIADPATDLLLDEWEIVRDYIDRGGNLLWMIEPEHRNTLTPLAEKLGVRFLPGVVVDTTTRQFKITQPDLIPIIKYPDHPITRRFNLTTLFPHAMALEITQPDYTFFPVIFSSDQSWTETSPIRDQIDYDENTETLGPLTIAMALTQKKGGENSQRILIIGDSDFIANSYLGNGGNLDLGMRIFNWLTADDQLIDLPTRPATDLDFELSKTASMIFGFGFLIILPLLLALTGVIIWWRRRRL